MKSQRLPAGMDVHTSSRVVGGPGGTEFRPSMRHAAGDSDQLATEHTTSATV
ncbi:MAG: hypothetical protein R3C01_02230 [Planctomycetaceae bacterium]